MSFNYTQSTLSFPDIDTIPSTSDSVAEPSSMAVAVVPKDRASVPQMIFPSSILDTISTTTIASNATQCSPMTQSSPAPLQSEPKLKKKDSFVWTYFSRTEVGDNKFLAKCQVEKRKFVNGSRICGTEYTSSGNTGTSNRKRHLENAHFISETSEAMKQRGSLKHYLTEKRLPDVRVSSMALM